MMFDREKMRFAVDLQKRSYKLLRWLDTALEKGVVSFDASHEYMSEAEAAREWIERHYLNIPDRCRVGRENLDAFARFFSTYLMTSFELVENPGVQLKSECGCFCYMCSYLAAAPHLRPKKVSARNKERAEKLKIQYIMELALENAVSITEDEALRLVGKGEISEDAAMAAYGNQLLGRVEGRSGGPAVLVLWREFAWNKSGSPKKNFKLEVKAIMDAEARLKEKLISM